MGTAMARNLLKSGQFVNVYVWNRTLSKCDELAAEGALVGQTPAEVISKCDLTFGILADPSAALAVVTSPGGVLEGITAGKAYIDMSTVDEQTNRAGLVRGHDQPRINPDLSGPAAGRALDVSRSANCRQGKAGFNAQRCNQAYVFM